MRSLFRTLLIIVSLCGAALEASLVSSVFTASIAGAETRAEFESRIIPVVKSRAWLEQRRKDIKAAGADQEMLAESFSGDLIVVYAQDQEKAIRYMTPREYSGSKTQLRALAVENLLHRVPKFERIIFNAELSTVSAGDDYTSGLLLADNIWSSSDFRDVPGDVVVAIPARDGILVTGSRSKTLKNFRALAAEFYAKGPYSVSEQLFVYRNKQFVPFRGGL
jgi:uncharacterized protein YtpQ (UPF0354 family)